MRSAKVKSCLAHGQRSTECVCMHCSKLWGGLQLMQSADDKHYLQPVGPEKGDFDWDMISRLFRLHDAPESCNLISILDETKPHCEESSRTMTCNDNTPTLVTRSVDFTSLSSSMDLEFPEASDFPVPLQHLRRQLSLHRNRWTSLATLIMVEGIHSWPVVHW